MTRVLVYEYLSGGGPLDGDDAARAELLAAGIAMRDAIAADLLRVPGCSVTVATADDDDVPPGRAERVVPRRGEAPLDFVARAARGHTQVWVVAPETGGLLAQCRARVGNDRWLGCSAEAIAIASSKRATTACLAAHGVRTSAAYTGDRRVAHWVVKPDDGAGAVATRRHADRAAAERDAAARRTRGDDVVLEPWVDGDALSLSLLCADGAAELLSVNRQEIGVDAAGAVRFDGVALDVMAPSDPRRAVLARLAGEVAAALPGLRGFVGIDLVWHPADGPVVVEVNPRVTCAYVGLSAALGRNLAADVLALHRAELADVR